MHHSTQEICLTGHCIHWTAYAYALYIGMMHALLASTQKDRMSDGRKSRGNKRQGQRWRESFSATRLFLLKIIPCSPVGTHTQTTPQPPVLSLSISRTGDKSFCSELASGQSGPRARECAREPRHRRRVSRVDVASSIGFERR